jgi:hypothetical protein
MRGGRYGEGGAYIYELWASLRNDTADRQENHR